MSHCDSVSLTKKKEMIPKGTLPISQGRQSWNRLERLQSEVRKHLAVRGSQVLERR